MYDGGVCLRGLLWGQGRMIWDGDVGDSSDKTDAAPDFVWSD